MKILHVIHDFLPRHQAGSELYCYHLSKAMQRRGCETALFFSEIDHTRAPYSVRRGEYDGLPFMEVINNQGFRSFEETYRNPAVERPFQEWLDEVQPDVVHFHHLLSLSYGLVRLCKERGAPVVFTLHDYWLTCPRGGGQRFRGEGQVCHDVDPSLCAECVARFAVPSAGGRLLKRLLAPLERSDDPTLLGELLRGRIRAPQRTFVRRGICAIDHDAREVLFAHPPSEIRFRRKVPDDALLQFAVGMDPSTYAQPGGAVRFRVRANGELLYEETLDPKRILADQGWRQAVIDLKPYSGKRVEFCFETEALPAGDNQFCSACWAAPRLLSPQGGRYQPSLTARVRSWGENWIASFNRKAMRRQVEARREATLGLFEQIDLFIAPSPFLRTKFIEYGLAPEKIVYSDYGIADLGYSTEKRAPTLPLRFTYVGTLVEHKGVHVLIDAFNQLDANAVVLDVYGAVNEFADYVQRLKAMIRHPGIHLRGRMENEEIPRILAESDALIVPSIWFENSPITIHEAFLARTPVIASRFGGMADLVRHEENGLLFEVGDAASLRQCLERCVQDPGLLERIRPTPSEVKSLDADAEWMEARYEELTKVKSKK